MKPNLILNETDLRAGIDNPSYEHAVNLKADLITVYQYMIDNEKDLKINLNYLEHANKCGTYRCVCGWWSYWLNIPIISKKISRYIIKYTSRFKNIFCNRKFFMCFEELVVLDSDGDYIKIYNLFFGDGGYATLPERLIRAESLEFSNKLIKNN